MNFKLTKYIIPSVIAMVLVGTYTNIDGFFIGNAMGDDGLAAINIVWPIVAFITSLGTGIGVGGSVIFNNMRGKNEQSSAEQVKSTMLFLLVVVGIATSILFKFIYKPLLVMMGAKGQVLSYSIDYAEVICIGAVFQIMGSGLVAILRNEQKTYYSMVCCIVGLAVHLFLDIVLVDTYKLGGVAISTVASQIIIMLLCFFALKSKKKAKINKRYILPILVGSTSPLGINFVPSIVLLLTNYFALQAGGTAAVSAYAVMSYAVYTFDYIFQGVCDGAQPIISYYNGAGDHQSKRQVLKVSAKILMLFSSLFIFITPALISIMPILFSISEEAAEMMQMGFVIYAVSYPFKATVKFIGSYYYACGRTKVSNLLIYVEPVVFTPLFLTALSHFMGVNRIWASLPVTQFSVTFLGILSLLLSNDR